MSLSLNNAAQAPSIAVGQSLFGSLNLGED